MADTAVENASQAVVAVGGVQSKSLPAPQLNDIIETQTRAIGLIMPPHDIRMIIDKTADFVAKNGTAFEQKILAQPKNVKFNFLHTTDPYHKYYQYKITEIKEGPEVAKAQFAASAAADEPAAATQANAEEEVAPPTQELRKPEDEKYTAHIPAGLTPQDLDIMKLTAQFVARNGSSFLNGLRAREEARREFFFLKDNHSLHTTFKRLTDAYSAVLLDSKDALVQLREDAADSAAVLQRCLQRLEWTRVKESEADEVKAEKERERLAMMLIDWHDFSVVRTIDFDPGEDVSRLGPPLTKQMVIQLNKGSDPDTEGAAVQPMEGVTPASGSAAGEVTPAADEEEAALIAAGHEEMDAVPTLPTTTILPPSLPTPPVPPPAQPLPATAPESAAGQVVVTMDEEGPIKVVRGYKRTAGGTEYDPSKYAVSPITGELVPLAEMQEHVRINLIDPKWKDQREAMLAKIKETTKASDTEIMDNLTRLAGTRPDVFGGSAAQLGSVIGEATGNPVLNSGQGAAPVLPKDGPTRQVVPGSAPTGKGTPALAPLPAAPAGAAPPVPPQARLWPRTLPPPSAPPKLVPPSAAPALPSGAPPNPPPPLAPPVAPPILAPPGGPPPLPLPGAPAPPGSMLPPYVAPPPPVPKPVLQPPEEQPDPKRQKT